MQDDLQRQLDEAIGRILQSKSRKKLIVAGPGTGKTTLFKKLLEELKKRDDSLVLTFINNLKNDLDKELSHLTHVFTFHGYCHYILRKHAFARVGLSDGFGYKPGVAALINDDWTFSRKEQLPKFSERMYNLQEDDALAFYLERGNYYDSIDYDDSVYRVYRELRRDTSNIVPASLVLVDEYQDFNRLEAGLIGLLAERNPIVIVGDDDQALYGQWRGSSEEFIRSLYNAGEYERFVLPFCMRCPEVVVRAMNDLIAEAKRLQKLQGRIEKPFEPFPPKKGADSAQYPRIKVVETSVQMRKANYFGRYVAEAIGHIPREEIEQSRKEGFPTVLIIGGKQYLKQIRAALAEKGFDVEENPEREPEKLSRDEGLRMLWDNHASNLGWRVVLAHDNPDFTAEIIARSVDGRLNLIDLLPQAYREAVLGEVRNLMNEQGEIDECQPPIPEVPPGPTIKLTSFEGSKGMSAQHVFIVGLHEGEFPSDAGNINDIEICKLGVALTRTRKQCYLMYTNRFAGVPKRPSSFLNWIRPERMERIRVDRTYWEGRPVR